MVLGVTVIEARTPPVRVTEVVPETAPLVA
jgi:hypothetical protein